MSFGRESAKKVGIAPITRFDTTGYKVTLAAEVKNFKAADRMDFKAAKRMDRFSQYAVAAAKEALMDSCLDLSKENAFRAGVVIGSGIGSLEMIESEYEKILKNQVNRVNPLMVPRMISNMAAGNVSIQLGLRGKCTNVVTACASGTHCIGDAFRAIQYEDADIMFAGGAESCICPTGVAGFQSLTALSTAADPLYASIPFDKNRKGFVLGEGAGVVVLEELEHAKARGLISMPRLSATVRLQMRITSRLLARMEAEPLRRWNLPWQRQRQHQKTLPISMRTEQERITTISLRRVRSSLHLARPQRR